jgi:hypothetical protein
MKYAIRHPDRVSHLLLLTTASASHDDYLLRQELPKRRADGDGEKLTLPTATAGGFLLHGSLPELAGDGRTRPGLTASPPAATVSPTAKMFCAALTSRS